MAIDFNGSSKNAELEYIDILLEGKSNEFKGRVLAFVRKYKIDAKDPTFMLLVALGNLDVALVDLPQAIDKGQQGMRGEIERVGGEFKQIWQSAVTALKSELADIQKVQQERNLTFATKERELGQKVNVIQTAISSLEANILALEGVESRVKADYLSLSVELRLRQKELANSFNKLEERDSIKLWEYDRWRAEHWLLAIGTSFLALVFCIDSWRTHSDLDRVSGKLENVLVKVGYNATKLGRIEKHLGVKKPKGE
jgi:hypothetical protein